MAFKRRGLLPGGCSGGGEGFVRGFRTVTEVIVVELRQRCGAMLCCGYQDRSNEMVEPTVRGSGGIESSVPHVI